MNRAMAPGSPSAPLSIILATSANASRGAGTPRRSASYAVIWALHSTARPSVSTPGLKYQPPTVQSQVQIAGAMQTRCGGRAMAAVHWVMPL